MKLSQLSRVGVAEAESRVVNEQGRLMSVEIQTIISITTVFKRSLVRMKY